MSVKINQLHTAVWIYDIDMNHIPWANEAGLKLWGSPSVEDLSTRDFKTGQSEAVRESLEQYKVAFEKGEVIQKNWLLLPNGIETPAFCQFSGIRLPDGRLAMLVEATINLLDTNLQHANTIISVYTTDGEFISGNPAFIVKFGNEISRLNELFCEPGLLDSLLNTISNDDEFEKDVVLKTLKGEVWFRILASKAKNQQGKDTLLIHHYNIHKSKVREESLRQQAWSDPLTGLVNRRGLTHCLDTIFQKQTPFTMLYVDLDGFKMVNDSLGHEQGDKVLIEVCKRLNNHKQEDDILCRFGGDEFIFILHHGANQADTEHRCNALIESISECYQNPHGRSLSLSASIGVASYPADADNEDRIIACADAAMNHAKKLGKKQWVRYQHGMERSLKRMSLVAQKLSFALQNKELSLHYQPILDVSENKITSFEALLRWNNDELGYVNPEEAIRVAEETGLIYEIEKWILNQAIHDLTVFKKTIHSEVTMAVNLSGLHLSNLLLVDSILEMLEEHGLQPEDLTIELTESVLFTDINQKDCPIKKLTDNKLKLKIDDFGTGYSSLAYLHIIPASVVKVDKSFLENMQCNTVVLECIQRLVGSLEMKSLIEGIETEEQAILLKSLGYDLQQGYFHGRPQPLEYYIN